MKISVVTPSYNQGRYIETTITSVISQGYPDLEYFVIDGGSTDETVEIIRRYETSLTRWASERDSGQSEAINKGFALCTGDVMCWLNSDDYFAPGTLMFVADYFSKNRGVDVLCGSMCTVDPTGTILSTQRGHYGGRRQLACYWRGYAMHQPSIFWRRRVYDRIGKLDERLHLTMDFDYWIRTSRKFEIRSVDRVLSFATAHPLQKTADSFAGYRRAQRRDVLRYFGSPLALRDWDIRVVVYGHMVKTLARKAIGRRTCYE